MGVISIVIGIINQLTTGGAPPCNNDSNNILVANGIDTDG